MSNEKKLKEVKKIARKKAKEVDEALATLLNFCLRRTCILERTIPSLYLYAIPYDKRKREEMETVFDLINLLRIKSKGRRPSIKRVESVVEQLIDWVPRAYIDIPLLSITKLARKYLMLYSKYEKLLLESESDIPHEAEVAKVDLNEVSLQLFKIEKLFGVDRSHLWSVLKSFLKLKEIYFSARNRFIQGYLPKLFSLLKAIDASIFYGNDERLSEAMDALLTAYFSYSRRRSIGLSSIIKNKLLEKLRTLKLDFERNVVHYIDATLLANPELGLSDDSSVKIRVPGLIPVKEISNVSESVDEDLREGLAFSFLCTYSVEDEFLKEESSKISYLPTILSAIKKLDNDLLKKFCLYYTIPDPIIERLKKPKKVSDRVAFLLSQFLAKERWFSREEHPFEEGADKNV